MEPTYSWVWIIYCITINLQGAILLKKMASLSHRSHQLSIYPQCKVGAHEPLLVKMLTFLVLGRTCVQHRFMSHKYGGSSRFRINTLLLSNLRHLIPLLIISDGPWVLGAWSDSVVLFVTECFIYTLSLHFGQLRASVLPDFHCTKTSKEVRVLHL